MTGQQQQKVDINSGECYDVGHSTESLNIAHLRLSDR